MTFVCLLRPAFDRPFLARADSRVRSVVDAHGDYLQAMRDTGRLILAGRCWDGPLGIVMFEASDRAAAEEVLAADPSLAAGVHTGELYEFNMPYPPV